MYSQDSDKVQETFGWEQEGEKAVLADYERNGRYCKSGLAYGEGFRARCVNTTQIMFENEPLFKPYACQPRDPSKKCQIQFQKEDDTTGTVEVECRCAMTDQTSGFCESVLGTEWYWEATQSMFVVYNNSDCHALDRHDLGAQRDSCGFKEACGSEESCKVKEEAWELAVNL